MIRRARSTTSRPATRVRRLAAAAVSAALVLGLGACSGDDDEPDERDSSPSAAGDAPVPTRVSIGRVAGELDARRRAEVKASVAEVVDGWIDAAYVGGEWPRGDFADYSDALRDFTPDTKRRAARDRRLLTNVAIGDRVESVQATRRVLQIDVLAPGGRPVGATARVLVRFRTDGDVRRVDLVRGRLMLTPTKKGWKVFGYDVSRSTLTPGDKPGEKSDRGNEKTGTTNGKGERR
ncbi:hypothetical protein [Nocardioides ochotonae]|uniref:hypothetical protein n=1 Tax=Nocardioides ochotonae TaxID=2685869 RepID=UPI00140BDEFE|nr:hypothetical protein [Nocardioides ochotonae]